MLRLKCQHCARMTRHAYLRPDDNYRDWIANEARQQYRLAASEAAAGLSPVVETFKLLGVDIAVRPGRIAAIMRMLDGDGRYTLALGDQLSEDQRQLLVEAVDMLIWELPDRQWFVREADEATGREAYAYLPLRT